MIFSILGEIILVFERLNIPISIRMSSALKDSGKNQKSVAKNFEIASLVYKKHLFICFIYTKMLIMMYNLFI